ncbi:MAG TPA: tRNA pseudouridine(38-40) synthase TruA [Prolixibacteraceae bacterium]|nr:tRNA pseudouridine(38-40) synthase TruA [Prolixibacteraceae bacterium]
MQRYFVQLAYNGTNYHGWQFQPNAVTVQELLEKAFSLLLGQKVEITGAGRTDTGVHASFFVAHFDVGNAIPDTDKLVQKLNSFLPNDILIYHIFTVEAGFHARFSALSRTYHYYLSDRKEPFRGEFTARYPYSLDVDLMNEAAALMLQFVDFTSFSKLHTDVKTNNCKVTTARWERRDGLLVFEIKADRFLRNMVRAVVGTLIDVGRGKISIPEFISIVESKDRREAGTSVDARGLFLTDIEYPQPVHAALLRSPSGFPF